MTASDLANSYLKKAMIRLEILSFLINKKAYSDVVREAQECVELALKGILRKVGVEPPMWHDVGDILIMHKMKIPKDVRQHLLKIKQISQWLRKERELSFYGDVDFIPTEEYRLKEARKAKSDAAFCLRIAKKVITL